VRANRAGLAVVAWTLVSCGGASSRPSAPLAPAATFEELGEQAVSALRESFWAGDGRWFLCDRGCGASNQDWGADALTFVTYLRWATTQDPALVPLFDRLIDTEPTYGLTSCNDLYCFDWSDMPAWDAVAAARTFEVTGDRRARDHAEGAYRHAESAGHYRGGACPEIRFQLPGGGGGGLKTLETESNLIKAALLLWQQTGDPRFLSEAIDDYAAVRRRYLDPLLPLYTVYVVDDGERCAQVPHRFFASVNGNMIWNGAQLALATGDPARLSEARATADAVDRELSDGRGVMADLQAENDVAEPLVEAFYALAVANGDRSARGWILRNADAARGARTATGLYGRFFDGPAPAPATVSTAWQTNGGLALAVAAAALDPSHPLGAQGAASDWTGGRAVELDLRLGSTGGALEFDGSGIALYGALGEECCEKGHEGLLLDGHPAVDQTGIWQNKSSAGRTLDDTVLFAWRWAEPGHHAISFVPGADNPKEGGPFLHLLRYLVLP
jgi:hypothetical protein